MSTTIINNPNAEGYRKFLTDLKTTTPPWLKIEEKFLKNYFDEKYTITFFFVIYMGIALVSMAKLWIVKADNCRIRWEFIDCKE